MTTSLRSEAEALARQLPSLNFKADATDAAHVGSAGRRKAGNGEHFWQYRHYRQEDDANRVDWRRSARGDEHFVRETELETARTVQFWCDDDAGFHWKDAGDLRTKAEEARLLMLALAILMSKDGERIGALGSGRKSSFGMRAIDRLNDDLVRGTSGHFPTAPKGAATLIIASDFYAPVSEWADRLRPLAAQCPEGVLLAVSSPLEVNFPFEGRVKLSHPGTGATRIVGRAETLKVQYQERFFAQREALLELANRMGWRFVAQTVGQSSLNAAARLKATIETFGDRS